MSLSPKIVIIQDYLRSGGTERNTVALANFCAQCGDAITVLTLRPGGVLVDELEPAVAVQSLQSFDSRLNVWAPGLVDALEALKPDVVLLMGTVANNLGSKLRQKFADVRLVATYRSGKPLSKHQLKALHCADAAVVNSEWAARVLVEHGLNAGFITVVNNPFIRTWDVRNEEMLATMRQDTRRATGIEDKVWVMVMVAGFRKHKGQDELIDAIAGVELDSTWELWFVGEGQYLEYCKRKVKKQGLQEHVRFWGYQKDPLKILAASDLLVSTSRTDSQPNALIEAHSLGLPIVAYDTGGASECFIPGETGVLVDQGDWGGLCGGIRKYTVDKKNNEKIGQTAQNWVLEKFDKTTNLERFRNALMDKMKT